MSSLLDGGRTSKLPKRFSGKEDLKKTNLKKHPFWEGGGLVWYELDDQTFFNIIHSAKYEFFYIIILFFK